MLFWILTHAGLPGVILQSPWPIQSLYLPVGQLIQAEAPVEDMCTSAAQSSHAVLTPAAALYLPAAQSVQTEAPAAEYVPAPQSVQATMLVCALHRKLCC